MGRTAKSRFLVPVLLLLLVAPLRLWAQSQSPVNTVDEGNGITKFEYDTNGDGKVDLSVELNSAGQKVREAYDFNHDGKMDDFYTYSKGVLVSRQIDTNFDGKIDLWVWLTDGIYVRKYERDTNFDGKPDIVKVFETKSEAEASAKGVK